MRRHANGWFLGSGARPVFFKLQERPPAQKQLEIARMQGKLPGLVKYLASAFGGVPA